MTLTLRALTAEDAEQIRIWRNADLSPWRTPYLLTEEMQLDWYVTVVCSRESKHRFWAVDESGRLVGMVGLTNVDWQNRIAECNLILAPDFMDQADAAVDLLLEQAFDYLGLATVCGECYGCSSMYVTWKDIVFRWQETTRCDAYMTYLPRRKFWQGQLHDSMYFSISVEAYHQRKSGSVDG